MTFAIKFNLTDRDIYIFNVPKFCKWQLLVKVKGFFTQKIQFIRICIKAESAMFKLWKIKNSFHPKEIFEGSYFPEMKMIENRYIFTKIIDLFIFKTTHITKIPDHAVEVILVTECFVIQKISPELKRTGLKIH